MQSEHSSEEESPGIVTLVDDKHIRVWSIDTGYQEFRFPLRTFPGIEAGTVVSYKQVRSIEEVQNGGSLSPMSEGPEVVKLHKSPIKFKVKTIIVFPPEDYRPYRQVITASQQPVVMAFSPDFHKIACFVKRNYIPGTVFEGYISRIPKENDALIPKLGTLFCLTKDELKEIIDPVTIIETFEQLPWNGPYQKSTSSTIMSEKLDDFKDFKNAVSTQMRAKISDAQIASKCESTGIIVRIEHTYAVLWNKTDGFLSANIQPHYFGFGTWVRYKCTDKKQCLDDGLITKTAEILEEVDSLRMCRVLDNILEVSALVKLFESNPVADETFVIGYDEVLGKVLCSRDELLCEQLNYGKEVEVFAFFLADYHRESNWIAFAVKARQNSWRPLKALPNEVRKLASKSLSDSLTDLQADNVRMDHTETSRDEKFNLRSQVNGTEKAVEVMTQDSDDDESANKIALGWLSDSVLKEQQNVKGELSRYLPKSGDTKKKCLGIIVVKMDDFAIVFSKPHGLSLLKREFLRSSEEFDNVCGLGKWIWAIFTGVEANDDNIRYKTMCVQNIEPAEPRLPTRVLGGFVQVKLQIEFNNETVKICETEPKKYAVETDLGNALISKTEYIDKEYEGSIPVLWITHIQEKCGCHWMVAQQSNLNAQQ
ncbi:hypothetical protein Ddc_07122 [Ditylenchus destructor]|nr:hypothetical protein Ddc_07122 [Ditylenchus destructor]